MVSANTRRVRSVTAPSSSAGVTSFTRRTVTPMRSRSSNSSMVPPYRQLLATSSSPAWQRPMMALKVAAMPEAQARAPTPPSTAAMRCSKLETVGLPTRV